MIKPVLLFGILGILTVSSAFATGGVDAGGGGAFVCRNADGSVRDAELLDLWEAKYVRRWPLARTNESVDAQIDRALAKLSAVDATFGRYIAEKVAAIRANYEVLPPDMAVGPPTDALNGYMKPGCPLEGMMYYDGDMNRMRMSGDIFGKLLSKTDEAASFLHEAIYKHYRESIQDQDSRKSRHLVGCLFSQGDCLKPASLADALAKAKKQATVYRCQSSQIDYYTWQFQDEQNNTRLRYLFRRVFDREFTSELYWDQVKHGNTWAPEDGAGFPKLRTLEPYGYMPYFFATEWMSEDQPGLKLKTVAIYERDVSEREKYVDLDEHVTCEPVTH